MREGPSARRTLLHILATFAGVIGPGLAWGHSPEGPAAEDPGGWLWLGALLLAAVFVVLRATRKPWSRPIASPPLRLGILGVLTLYLVTLGPHLSHHLAAAKAAESACAVLIVTEGIFNGLTPLEPPALPALECGPVLSLPVLSQLSAVLLPATSVRDPPLTVQVA